MTRELIQRYQPGGDLYAHWANEVGEGGANLIARAALTGDRTQITDAITRARYGEKLDASTLSNFGRLITTDPFGAPLETANTALGNLGNSAILGLLKNPWVLAALVLGVIIWAGGGPWLGRQLKGVFK